MVTMAGERCPCGRPFRLLAGIEGRNDDILHRLVERLTAQEVANPAVQVELRDSLQDERDTAGKFKLIESRLPRLAAAGR
jgi:hypothetical protein